MPIPGLISLTVWKIAACVPSNTIVPVAAWWTFRLHFPVLHQWDGQNRGAMVYKAELAPNSVNGRIF